MMGDLSRWNDDRLDDLAAQVRANARNLEAISDLRTELASVQITLRQIDEEAASCVRGLDELKRDLARRSKVQHDERKADLRWMIGTLLAVGMLVVAALAVLIG